MPQAAHDFTAVDYFIGGAAILLVAAVLGAITNAVLREAGFGLVINGILMSAGFALGIAARAATLGFQ